MNQVNYEDFRRIGSRQNIRFSALCTIKLYKIRYSEECNKIQNIN